MHLWAEGNLMLVTKTIWFSLISLWNMALIMSLEDILSLASWKRSVPWGLSLLPVVFWWVAFVLEMVKLFKGGSWQDSVQEIFFAYVLWLNIPLASASSLYIVLLPMLTDDLSPSIDN